MQYKHINAINDLMKDKENEVTWFKIYKIFEDVLKDFNNQQIIEENFGNITGLLMRSIQSERSRLNGIAIEVLKLVSKTMGSKLVLNGYLPILLKLSGRSNKIFITRSQEGMEAIINCVDRKTLIKAINDNITNLNKNVRYSVYKLVIMRAEALGNMYGTYIERGMKDSAQEVRLLCKNAGVRKEIKAEETRAIEKKPTVGLTPRKVKKADIKVDRIKDLENEMKKINEIKTEKDLNRCIFKSKLKQLEEERKNNIVEKNDKLEKYFDKYKSKEINEVLPTRRTSVENIRNIIDDYKKSVGEFEISNIAGKEYIKTRIDNHEEKHCVNTYDRFYLGKSNIKKTDMCERDVNILDIVNNKKSDDIFVSMKPMNVDKNNVVNEYKFNIKDNCIGSNKVEHYYSDLENLKDDFIGSDKVEKLEKNIRFNKSDYNKIANSIVNSNTIADSLVNSNTIADSIVHNNAIADSIVNSNTVADSIVHNNTIADSIVHNNTIADSIVNNNTIADSIVNSNTVADSIVHNNTIADSIVHNNTIADSIVHNNMIADSIVHNNTIADNTADINSKIGYKSVASNDVLECNINNAVVNSLSEFNNNFDAEKPFNLSTKLVVNNLSDFTDNIDVVMENQIKDSDFIFENSSIKPDLNSITVIEEINYVNDNNRTENNFNTFLKKTKDNRVSQENSLNEVKDANVELINNVIVENNGQPGFNNQSTELINNVIVENNGQPGFNNQSTELSNLGNNRIVVEYNNQLDLSENGDKYDHKCNSFIGETLLFANEICSSVSKEMSIVHQQINEKAANEIICSGSVSNINGSEESIDECSLIFEDNNCFEDGMQQINRTIANISISEISLNNKLNEDVCCDEKMELDDVKDVKETKTVKEDACLSEFEDRKVIEEAKKTGIVKEKTRITEENNNQIMETYKKELKEEYDNVDDRIYDLNDVQKGKEEYGNTDNRIYDLNDIQEEKSKTNAIEEDGIKVNESKANVIEEDGIKANVIEGDEIKVNESKANVIEEYEIKANVIEEDKIKANVIEKDEIKANVIEEDENKANVIEENEIKANDFNNKPLDLEMNNESMDCTFIEFVNPIYGKDDVDKRSSLNDKLCYTDVELETNEDKLRESINSPNVKLSYENLELKNFMDSNQILKDGYLKAEKDFSDYKEIINENEDLKDIKITGKNNTILFDYDENIDINGMEYSFLDSCSVVGLSGEPNDLNNNTVDHTIVLGNINKDSGLMEFCETALQNSVLHNESTKSHNIFNETLFKNNDVVIPETNCSNKPIFDISLSFCGINNSETMKEDTIREDTVITEDHK